MSPSRVSARFKWIKNAMRIDTTQCDASVTRRQQSMEKDSLWRAQRPILRAKGLERHDC
jgi:hypothetical protein